MAVQMPHAGLLFMHRLVRMTTTSQRHLSYRDMLLHTWKQTRSVSTASVKCNKDSEDKSEPLSTNLSSRQAFLSRRRRSLSPLDRISSLLPNDALSPEVMQLMEQNQEDTMNTNIQVQEEDPESHPASEIETSVSKTLPGERVLAFGELLVAEYRKSRVEFRKMFTLQEGTRLMSSWGVIQHSDIAGQHAGCFLKTNRGVHIFVRRASLEDYVLYMKRGPAIAYPKDAAAMLMMMDVTEGDHVLESGSGSGAMSLFLSRAVGCRGRVLSVEVREDHHKRAVLNYKRWRTSWNLRRGEEWPDNVHFLNADLRSASSLLPDKAFNAVALDMINPHLALPTVIPHLHHGAVCAVYLANVTQVVDLLEGLRCLALPLLCEHIMEVPVRDWVVAPARQKNGEYCTRKAPVLDGDQREEGDASDEDDASDEADKEAEEQPAFGSVPYIARPHPEQKSHTAFLVKLRKCVR